MTNMLTCVLHSRTKAHASSSSPGGSCAINLGIPLPNMLVSQTNSITVEARIPASLDLNLHREPSLNVKRGRDSWMLRVVFKMLRKTNWTRIIGSKG